MTQLNTPYPATAYLTGFLALHRDRLGLELAQADAALELFLRVFSRAGLARVRAALAALAEPPPSAEAFLAHADLYLATIDPVVRFLQGRDPSLALRIAGREMLPEGPRFDPLDGPSPGGDANMLGWAFGELGVADRAKHLASLYIDDLADVIRDGIAPMFELARYGEQLAASAPSFDPLAAALAAPPNVIDQVVDEVAGELAARHRPDVVALTVPFPGNLYAALRIARAIRRALPSVRIALGGGYVNTELRELAEPRLFDDVDYVTLDDGERPLLAILEHLAAPAPAAGAAPPAHAEPRLLRTFVRRPDRTIALVSDPSLHDIPIAAAGTPSYAGLPLDRYVSLVEMLNPMNRLWSDGRWNKLTVAHGCYWKRCAFCDTSLDYIARYDRAPADLLVDRVEALIAETGTTGFHFVDEAAPPSALRALAERLIARGVQITWWGNIRFESAFTPELAQLLARSGLVAVTGGLEVASDRLLARMDKGVTVEQVARVTRGFADAGVMVHAYLMYGFPTQTTQETIDALERVRQLFAAGCIRSAFWHRFTATVHSPIGRAPAVYGIRTRVPSTTAFARNDLPFEDPTGTDHDALGVGLRRALYNFMHGIGLDDEPHHWFDRGAPRTTVDPDLVANALSTSLQ